MPLCLWIPLSSNIYGALISSAAPSILVISSPNLITLAVFGFAICSSVGLFPPGIPPPKYKYPSPSSSTNTAGSKSHTTPFPTPSVLELTNAWPIGSVHGPIGLSAVSTPIPPPPFAK